MEYACRYAKRAVLLLCTIKRCMLANAYCYNVLEQHTLRLVLASSLRTFKALLAHPLHVLMVLYTACHIISTAPYRNALLLYSQYGRNFFHQHGKYKSADRQYSIHCFYLFSVLHDSAQLSTIQDGESRWYELCREQNARSFFVRLLLTVTR